MRRLLVAILFLLITLTGFSKNMDQLKYLALGDSYTIGENVEAVQRWPVQLVSELRKQGIKIADPLILATTGWTTDELIAGIKNQDPKGPFDLVTLLIGVNNQYRRYRLKDFKKEFRFLLELAVKFTGNNREKVVVLSIPDWGVMPFAKKMEREKIAAEIHEFNRLKKEVCLSMNITFVDITLVSKRAASDPSLIAGDGLHPSGKQYTLWVHKLLPHVLNLLGKHK